ncbi:kinase-like domain-containing protein [Podospora conica]|nr:kinase-like domain-containing protein [Schizothecium conicum]
MLAPAAPALKTVRGFATPAASGDEDDSDCFGKSRARGNTPAKRSHRPLPIDDLISANCSPVLMPVTPPGASGIGKMRVQLESLNLNSDRSNLSSRASSMTRGDSQPVWSPNPSDGTVNSSRRPSRSTLRGISRTKSNSTSGDETSSNATTSYEINLEHDFGVDSGVLPTYGELHGGQQPKMTADDFESLRCLGKGTYGTVLLVKQRSTGRLYAQKQFKKASLVVHKKLVEQTKTERQILESVNRHPFVVKLFYAFQDQEKLYLILEYGQGGELFTHLNSEKMFPEQTAAFYMAELVLALSHLHNTLGVVYRDLKPENCLLDSQGHLLLTDFGLSKVAVDAAEECNSMLGTIAYMAPEIILGKKYGKAVDWWSFGALGYDFLTGSPPFRGQNNAKVQENIVKQKLALPFFLGPDAKDLLTRLLRKDPAKRLGSSMPKDLAIIKKHRFFKKIDWARLANRELEAPIQPLITDPELAENFAPEFTDLSLSPVVSRYDDNPWGATSGKEKEDPFGGFSFVGSSSLIETGGAFRLTA